MQEFNKSAKRCVSGLRFIFHRSEETEPKKQNPSTMERSFTELRFASVPALDCEDPGRLSTVQMNALRAPLTVSPELKEDMCSFSLDRADDFIDGINCLCNPGSVRFEIGSGRDGCACRSSPRWNPWVCGHTR